MRSFNEMLCRFHPPDEAGGAGLLEALHRLRPPGLEMRYSNRAASCTLVISGRTVGYTPNTGWGGVSHLVSYHLNTGEWRHNGPLRVEGDRRVCEVHSMSTDPEGRLHMVSFVYSVEGEDPVRPYALRDGHPFHPRFLVVDPTSYFRNSED